MSWKLKYRLLELGTLRICGPELKSKKALEYRVSSLGATTVVDAGVAKDA